MKRIITRQHKIILGGLGVLVLAAGIVWAVSPHFISVTATIQQDGDLDVKFKEAGLGTNQTINYLATADATVTCTCVTKKGNCPQAANKETFTEAVAEPATFNSGKNGNVTATITLEAPDCPASDPPTCGNGQDFVLSAVTWENIQLTDQTTPVGPVPATPSSVSATFFTCPE
jgi:hypothetical protein